jgi:hypothetical protein
MVVGICVGSEVGWPLVTVTMPRDLAGAAAGVWARAAGASSAAAMPWREKEKEAQVKRMESTL